MEVTIEVICIKMEVIWVYIEILRALIVVPFWDLLHFA